MSQTRRFDFDLAQGAILVLQKMEEYAPDPAVFEAAIRKIRELRLAALKSELVDEKEIEITAGQSCPASI